MKVLIVDDSAAMRASLMTHLREIQDVEVTEPAMDGVEALNFLQMSETDVIILDVRMPKLNGLKVLEEIKKKKKTPIVIVFTNYPYPQYREHCLAAGADYFFSKSSEFEALFGVLTHLSSLTA